MGGGLLELEGLGVFHSATNSSAHWKKRDSNSSGSTCSSRAADAKETRGFDKKEIYEKLASVREQLLNQ
eukprot:2633465-Rhodomonas_salina.1